MAGASYVGAQLRAKLIPNADTIKHMIKREKSRLYHDKIHHIQLITMKAQQAKLLEAVEGDKHEDPTADIISHSVSTSTLPSERNSLIAKSTSSHILSAINVAEAKVNDLPSSNSTSAAAKSVHANYIKILNTEIEKESIEIVNHTLSIDFVFTANRCWISKPVQLVPGEYLLYVDVCFTGKRDNLYSSLHTSTNGVDDKKKEQVEELLCYEDVKLMCLPRDITEAPWMEAPLLKRLQAQQHIFHSPVSEGHHALKHKTSNRANQSYPSFSNYKSAGSLTSSTSVQQLERQIFPRQESTTTHIDLNTKPLDHIIWLEISSFDVIKVSADVSNQEVTIVYDIDMETGEEKEKVNGKRTNQMKRDGLSQSVDRIEPAQSKDMNIDSMSSVEEAAMQAVENKDRSVAEAESTPQPIFTIQHSLPEEIPPECWPFLSETQAEAASTYLSIQMTQQREYAEHLGSKFVGIANRVNALKKKIIVNRKSVLND
jgi:hypothetical protein